MATILDEHLTGDGYSVTCLFGSQRLRLHLSSVPTAENRAELITATEQRLLDEEVERLQLTTLERRNDGILNW